MSDWFYLQRDCRQGDPLSPYLFILCAEILALLIRNNPNIKGIIVGITEFRMSQYADDTSMILDGSERSLNACITTLKFYAEASGLYMNMDKTQVIWIGSKKNCRERLCEQYNFVWDNIVFKALGIKFTKI